MPTPASGKGQQKIVSAAIKYGPLAYAAARKYGPELMDQLRREGMPIHDAIDSRISGKNHRKLAMEHADSVVDGSVMQVFHHSEPYWVVFSGDEPIASHPRTNVPWEVLLRHVDLGKRVRPEETRGVRGLLGRAGGRKGRMPQAPSSTPADSAGPRRSTPTNPATPTEGGAPRHTAERPAGERQVAEGRIVDEPWSRGPRS